MNRVVIANRRASGDVAAIRKIEKKAQQRECDRNSFFVFDCYLAEERLI
jgi:hypothetical protein